MNRLVAAAFTALAAFAALPALAHEGHGAPLLHMHDAEQLGLGALAGLAVAVAAAAWVWFRGRR
jgi:hypothetical protein